MILFFVSLMAIVMLGHALSRSESHLLLPWRAAPLSVFYSSSQASAVEHSLRV